MGIIHQILSQYGSQGSTAFGSDFLQIIFKNSILVSQEKSHVPIIKKILLILLILLRKTTTKKNNHSSF
jgi:hypothetical protein